MLSIEGSSFEEEKLWAESVGDEKYQRQLDMAQEIIGIMGWDIQVNREMIRHFADHYERVVTA